MTTEIMTIHSALSNLKILDNRISSIIDEGKYCLTAKTVAEKINGVERDKCEKQIISNYDKVRDLINRRTAIKKGIVLSNAVTKVQINGVEYTVAEAIEMKNHGIDFDVQLFNRMKFQYAQALVLIEKENKSLENKADDYVTGMLGGKESKTSSDAFIKVRGQYIEANTLELVNPIDIKEKIDSLQEKIDKFISEVDSILSVSNALTTIEIEY